MKPTKTMVRLLRLARENRGQIDYCGKREETAAEKLEQMGAVTRQRFSSKYRIRLPRGLWTYRYCPTGLIRISRDVK